MPECEHAVRVLVLERKLAGQRARSRMLKAELRAARQMLALHRAAADQMERVWNNYLAANGFRKLFTLWANVRAAAHMLGFTDAQIEQCADRLSIAQIREMVKPRQS